MYRLLGVCPTAVIGDVSQGAHWWQGALWHCADRRKYPGRSAAGKDGRWRILPLLMMNHQIIIHYTYYNPSC